MTDKEKAKNIRISPQAWRLIRWAKYKLKTESYSDTIIKLYNNLANPGKNNYTLENQRSTDGIEAIISKIPKDQFLSSDRPKMILISSEAFAILRSFKEAASLQYSSAIEALVEQSGLKPKHLNS